MQFENHPPDKQGFSSEKTGKTLTRVLNKSCFFVSVFHRILDFKAGLDFYHGPFFILSSKLHHESVFHQRPGRRQQGV